MTPERAAGSAAYLDRLGLTGADLPPTLETLVTVHRRHLDAVAYENVSTMLGRPPSVRPADCLARVGQVGRAGYCFHQNAALELALRELGFDVARRHGHVWTDEDSRLSGVLNHLALVVDGLATRANPGGRWWADVGLGDCLRDPLPVVAGRYQQGPFRYEITDVRADGWSFRHDPTGSFSGIEVTTAATDQPAVAAAHAALTTPPEGAFTRLVVVQRRRPDSADTVRGCLWTHVDAAGPRQTELASYDGWRAVVTGDLGLSLEGLDDQDLHSLYDDQWRRHRAWTAAGRP